VHVAAKNVLWQLIRSIPATHAQGLPFKNCRYTLKNTVFGLWKNAQGFFISTNIPPPPEALKNLKAPKPLFLRVTQK
jgi:hypothetical protein